MTICAVLRCNLGLVAAKAASANPYPNPRPIEYAAIRAMIEAAYRGSEPRGDYR
jgi:predicted transcriptional regulator